MWTYTIGVVAAILPERWRTARFGELGVDWPRATAISAVLEGYGAGTEILDETDLSGNLQLEFVYFAGKRIAHRVPSSGNIYYYEADMLGSSRTIVQAGQTSPCFDADFLPFGGERDITNTCSQSYNFEGKKRDPETGNDDFGARYYSSRLSRWLSPDWSSVPAPVPYANLANPQTLNLYAMVSDNPETFADLDGHGCTAAMPGTLGECKNNSDTPEGTPTGGKDPNPTGTGTGQSTTQQALQALADSVVSLGKSAINQVIGLNNAVNGAVDAAISPFTSFQFGQVPELQPSNSNQKTAMSSSDLALALVPIGGELEGVTKASKIETLTADAEKLYPKLAGKWDNHHITPKFLGGLKDGPTRRISRAYHQLITNEFRTLAGYGRNIERSAAEVGRIMEQVYSKFPLP